MKKSLDIICENCDSEFSLSFQENLVRSYEELKCAFCGQNIEIPSDEEVEDGYFEQTDMWDDV